MREAFVAESDDDFDLPSVVKRKAPARAQRSSAKPQRKAGAGERLLTYVLRHPRRILAAAFLTGCGGAIAWNALLLQSSHHPAPLFSQRAPEPMVAEASAPAFSQPLPPMRPDAGASEMQTMLSAQQQPIPETTAVQEANAAPAMTAPKPVPRGAIADLIRNGGGSAQPPARATQVAAVPPPARAPANRDPIGEIIRLGGPVPMPPANVGRSDAGDLVLSGQRALARLGYSVQVDGLMGAETRQAIERFEQDRNLPVTGKFSSRTVRELTALSGIVVQ